MRRLVSATCVLAAATGSAMSITPSASAHVSRYCEKPDNAGAFLAVSAGVSCVTAERVKRRIMSPGCYVKTRCEAAGFRCVAYWEGRFDRPFEYTHHAMCVSGWRWIVWDGG